MVPAVRSGPLPYAKTAPMTQCSMGAVWAVMHVFPLFPLDGAKSARFQAQMTFLTQAPSCDRGVFHHGQAERQLVLAAVLRPPPKRRVCYEAIAL